MPGFNVAQLAVGIYDAGGLVAVGDDGFGQPVSGRAKLVMVDAQEALTVRAPVQGEAQRERDKEGQEPERPAGPAPGAGAGGILRRVIIRGVEYGLPAGEREDNRLVGGVVVGQGELVIMMLDGPEDEDGRQREERQDDAADEPFVCGEPGVSCHQVSP